MMHLFDILNRTAPEPWSEAENLPWNEPAFSLRMLNEHLNQAHDAASRRLEIIDQHVQFIHSWVLNGVPSRILDMTCGPGLYLERLAQLNHVCYGIDYSPASINYARRQAERALLDITYSLSDVRVADFRSNWDLAMMIYGEFNTFRTADARRVLQKAYHAIRPGGRLLLEPSAFEQIRRTGQRPPSWTTYRSGLFSENPYLELSEAFWDDESCTATTRYFVVDLETSAVERYSSSYQAYTIAQYSDLLQSCGFTDLQYFVSLQPARLQEAVNIQVSTSVEQANLDTLDDFIVILANKW